MQTCKILTWCSQCRLRTFNFGCSLIRPLSHGTVLVWHVFYFHPASIETFNASGWRFREGNATCFTANGGWQLAFRQVKNESERTPQLLEGFRGPLLDPRWLTNSCCKTQIHQIIPFKAQWSSQGILGLECSHKWNTTCLPVISNLQWSKVIFR